jgi:signal transduction histidine kinase/CheY-like chemotaxis protein
LENAKIETQIIDCFGYLPAFYVPALGQPAVLTGLWAQTVNSYLDNPLPTLFKEKLLTLLSRDSKNSYLQIFHSARLKKLGFGSSQLLNIIQRPAPDFQNVFEFMERSHCEINFVRAWPAEESMLEEAVLSCCVGLFANRETESCQKYLRMTVSRADYQSLIVLLAYLRSNIMWVEGYPEIVGRVDRANHAPRPLFEVEAANSTKHQFLANMSHEIRTPIGAIQGFVKLMKSPTLKRSELNNFVSIVERNADQLLLVIDDILDLSKVESGRMTVNPTEFKLLDLVAEISSIAQFKAREKGLLFELVIDGKVPEQITSDSTRIRQILSNVINNAIKFTPRGKVTLKVSYDESMLRFNVIDTGIGISQEQAARLFRPFTQVDLSSSRKFGGTGLGLILTRQLCRMFNGNLSLVKSDLGAGTEFEAMVRVLVTPNVRMISGHEKRLATDSVTQPVSENRLKGIRILVVEDSLDNQELMQIVLSNAGADVDFASDGIEGVDMAMNNSYDAVLMDIQMPRMDGHEASKTLRSNGYRKPVVALTAHAQKEARDLCINSGFSDFLTKPIQQDVIISTLAKVIANVQLH